MSNDLLRIAIPNKGSLSQSASDILREAGYKQRLDAKQLTLTDADNGVEFFYLRPRDIALYVGEGTLDIGITGRDLLLDSGAKAEEVLSLGFGRSRFRFAARPGTVGATEDLAGKRIATSYDGVVRRYLEERGIDAEPIGEPGDGRIGRTGLPALDLTDVLLREPFSRELGLRQPRRDTQRAHALAEASAMCGALAEARAAGARWRRRRDGLVHTHFSQSGIPISCAPLSRGCAPTAFE